MIWQKSFGGETIRTQGRRFFAQSGDLILSVQDNGPGLPKTEHKRIFQKFYRVDDRLARQKEGSGLGLAIVDHIVRAHGGRVELESELGKGSTFSIVLTAENPVPVLGAQPSRA